MHCGGDILLRSDSAQHSQMSTDFKIFRSHHTLIYYRKLILKIPIKIQQHLHQLKEKCKHSYKENLRHQGPSFLPNHMTVSTWHTLLKLPFHAGTSLVPASALPECQLQQMDSSQAYKGRELLHSTLYLTNNLRYNFM